MSYIMQYSEMAKVCSNKNCVTVYGDTAKIVNTIAIITVLLISFGLLAKAFK